MNFFVKIYLIFTIRLKNDEGFNALELCINDEICKLLQDKINERFENKEQTLSNSPTFESAQYAPPKTPIAMGWLFKTGPLIFNIKRRFFVLDPYDGTFIRFKSREDYPLKPRFLN